MKTILKNNIYEIVVEKSKFIAYIKHVETSEDALHYIKEIKKLHPNAAHCCFAYQIDNNKVRQSDDGEPNGTAGRPILSIIKHNNLFNTLIVVVRYFGGTKLGTGGLIRAYQMSAKKVIETSHIGQYIKLITFNFSVTYQNHIKIIQAIRKSKIKVINQVFMPDVVLVTIENDTQSIQEFKKLYHHLIEEINV
jgi:uncharacterized YigZ family protein